ncbi:MAG: replicative DNA helicase [Bacteroidales bacterium]|nr:replicative DNA helicase [Candidatus Colimorpha onthohippi]
MPRSKERMSYAKAFDLNGKLPPQALEMERSVLGALMIDQNALSNVIESLHSDCFYDPRHQTIFRAVNKLFELNKPIDIPMVVNQLRQDGALEAAGGAYYVSELTNTVVSAAHIEYHTRILIEKFIQREIIRVSTDTLTKAFEETTDVVDLLDSTEQRLMDINDKNFRSDIQPISQLVRLANEQIKAAQESEGNTVGLPTGFVALDQITAGFHPGTLIILAGRPAMGKTALALSMARNMAIQFNRPVAFFSLEMPGEELAMRLISSEAGIPGDQLKKGNIGKYEQAALNEKSQILANAPIYIDATSQLSIYELRAKCRRMKQQYKIEMVFIDYLQLMTAGGESSRGGTREQEISTISRQLKALSKELGIPVLALSQLSRAVETRGGSKEPQLSDLRESGAIEQDADIVMFVYRPEYYGLDEDDKGSTLGKADIILAKHRSGSTGKVRTKFIGKFARFENDDSGSVDSGFGTMPMGSGFDDRSQTAITIPSRMNSDVSSDLGSGGAFPPVPDDDVPF